MKFECLSKCSALCNIRTGKPTAGPFGLEMLAVAVLWKKLSRTAWGL